MMLVLLRSEPVVVTVTAIVQQCKRHKLMPLGSPLRTLLTALHFFCMAQGSRPGPAQVQQHCSMCVAFRVKAGYATGSLLWPW